MSKIDKNKYDYIIYADASGDDGLVNPAVKTPGCSSLVQTVAYFVTSRYDDSYNMEVLDDIKALIGLPSDKELKYRHIRKAHNPKNVFDLICKLRGSLYSTTCFKIDYMKASPSSDEYCEPTILSALTHIAPYHLFRQEANSLLFVFDHMKERDEVLIPQANLGHPCDIIFRDSKDCRFSLIQIADIFSGIIRNFIEHIEVEPTKNLPPCFKKGDLCQNKVLMNVCKFSGFSKKRISIPHATNFFRISPLMFVDDCGYIVMHTFASVPVSSIKRYSFVDCTLGFRPKNNL